MSELRKTLLEATAVAIIAMIATAMISSASRRSNCGGNSAALAHMYFYESFASEAAARSPDHRFRVTAITPEQREQFALVRHSSWNSNARHLASTLPYPDPPAAPRRIIMVCERPFTNVPRRLLWPSPLTHAAAFSDGTVGLISVAEFAALDRSTLKPLGELLDPSKP